MPAYLCCHSLFLGATSFCHPPSPQSERDSKEEIAKVFALFDHEGSGKIAFRDLKVRPQRVCAPIDVLRVCSDCRMPAPPMHSPDPPPLPQRVITELGENISDEEMREMIEEADRDGDGFVVFEDFFRIMKKSSPDDDDEDDE